MPEYNVVLEMEITDTHIFVVPVEADSEAEATEKARQVFHPGDHFSHTRDSDYTDEQIQNATVSSVDLQ